MTANGIDHVLVVGATGFTGRAVVNRLADTDIRMRALTRQPGDVGLPDDVDVVVGDASDRAVLQRAGDGVEAVFLVWPFWTAEGASATIEALTSSARRVVYLSSIGVQDDGGSAGDPITSCHAAVEQTIRGAGVEWTMIRSGGMAKNTTAWADSIRNESAVHWIYGDAVRVLVHDDDLATVAELALTTDGHVGHSYEITGDAPISQRHQAEAIGDALGRPIAWHELGRDEMRRRLLDQGWPAETAEGALDSWQGSIAKPEVPSDEFERVTGRAPASFAKWARDRVELFR